MMTDWYQKSINTLQLNGKAERTQEAEGIRRVQVVRLPADADEADRAR